MALTITMLNDTMVNVSLLIGASEKIIIVVMEEGEKMEHKEIKPCPFCGSKDIYCDDAGRGTDMWFVQCNDCDATFPHFDSKEQAVRAWNRRTD